MNSEYSREESLYDLAVRRIEPRLKRPLRPAEVRTLRAAGMGENAECACSTSCQDSDSEYRNGKGIVRARLVVWLCTDPEALKCIHPRGIHIRDAFIKAAEPKRDRDLGLDLDSTKIPFSFYLWNCTIENGIQLRDARIDGLLAFPGCDTTEVRMDRIVASGDIWLNRDPDPATGKSEKLFRASKGVSAVGAKIDGDLQLQEAIVGSLDLSRASIAGSLNLAGAQVKSTVDLRGASCTSFDDESFNWPEGVSRLDGFGYSRISSVTANDRLRWLKNQHPDDRSSLQPYEQLASALQKIGERSVARNVLVKMESMLWRRKLIQASRIQKPWICLGFLWGLIAGYGFKPGRAVLFIVGFWAIGCLVFFNAEKANVLSDTNVIAIGDSAKAAEPKPEDGGEFESSPPFIPWVYSLDMLLPIIDLHQKIHWSAKPEDSEVSWFVPNHKSVYRYLVIHKIAGFVLSLSFVIALTQMLSRARSRGVV